MDGHRALLWNIKSCDLVMSQTWKTPHTHTHTQNQELTICERFILGGFSNTPCENTPHPHTLPLHPGVRGVSGWVVRADPTLTGAVFTGCCTGNHANLILGQYWGGGVVSVTPIGIVKVLWRVQ